MITLRHYQDLLINRVRDAFAKHKRVLMVAPTGSGKTICFSYLAARVSENKKHILIIVHREELIDQVSTTLDDFDIPHGIIAANYPMQLRFPVQVASVWTLKNRLNKVRYPALIILDEAHHCILNTTWGKVISHFERARVLGVTATPERLSGEGLGEVFEHMIVGPSVRNLIDGGALSDYRIFAPPTIDTQGLHTRMGEFKQDEVLARVDKPTITGDAIKHYKRLSDGKAAVAFCVSVDHARHVAEQFRQAGYSSVSIDGRMERALRREVVRDFRLGKIQVLTSCDVISEGFDVPGIITAILLRPTQSRALAMQQMGRALRPCEGKDCAMIVDHAGNVFRHGLPDDEYEWSLEGRKRTGHESEPTVKIRICKTCFAALPSGAIKCQWCGAMVEFDPRQVKQVDGELVELDKEVIKRQARKEQGHAETLEDLIALGKSRGYKNPAAWAKYVFNGRLSKQQKRATG